MNLKLFRCKEQMGSNCESKGKNRGRSLKMLLEGKINLVEEGQ